MKTTTCCMARNRNTRFLLAVCPLLSVCCLVGIPAEAGDLITDGLTVNEDAAFYGKVELAPPTPGYVPTNGPVLYYPFRTNGGSVVTDCSPESNNGTVDGATFTSSGKVDGGAYSFDGNDHIAVADDDSLTFGDSTYDYPFTLSAWVYLTGSGWGTIVSKSESGNSEYIVNSNHDSGYVRIWLIDQSGNYQSRRDAKEGSLTASTWNHLVITYDGRGGSTAANGLSIYVDAVDQSDDVSNSGSYVAMENRTAVLKVGQQNSGSNQYYFNGKMDEVLIYNRVLSQAEIAALYAYGTPSTNAYAGHLVVGTISASSNATVTVNALLDATQGVRVPKGGDLSMGSFTSAP